MNSKTIYRIVSVLGASCILLTFFLVRGMEAKSIGGMEKQSYLPFPRFKDSLMPTPGFSSLLSLKSNEVPPHKTFQDHLDAILRKEKHLKEEGVSLHENSRQRRTILFKIFLFFKILAKEALFFGKKFVKFG